MHFQNVLLAGLKNSSDEAGWCSYVKDAFAKVTGDDVSFSLCAIGYESFDELKASFEKTEIPELIEINKIQDEISRISSIFVPDNSSFSEDLFSSCVDISSGSAGSFRYFK